MLALNVALIVVTLSTLCVTYRVLRGPSWGDRVMAFDFLSSNIVLLIVLLAVRTRFESFLDAALVLSLLGFLGTVALTRYLLLGRVMR
jgi:multicomponent K+:H+ antiporter subunit F/multicomponent Na+:H+ antiporter subunit F